MEKLEYLDHLHRDIFLNYIMSECIIIELLLHNAVDVVEDNKIETEQQFYDNFREHPVLIDYQYGDVSYFERLRDPEYRCLLIQVGNIIRNYTSEVSKRTLCASIARIYMKKNKFKKL